MSPTSTPAVAPSAHTATRLCTRVWRGAGRGRVAHAVRTSPSNALSTTITPIMARSSAASIALSNARCATTGAANAAGTDQITSHRTTFRSAVLDRRWIAAPNGFISEEATRSEAIARPGGTWNTPTSSGVSNAPPPMPVSPMTPPRTKPAAMIA